MVGRQNIPSQPMPGGCPSRRQCGGTPGTPEFQIAKERDGRVPTAVATLASGAASLDEAKRFYLYTGAA